MQKSNITFSYLQLVDMDYLLRKAIDKNNNDIAVLAKGSSVSVEFSDLISSLSDENARLEDIRNKISVALHGGV